MAVAVAPGLVTSISFNAPGFSVTSRRPSGRKVIAHGSLNVAMPVAANGRPPVLPATGVAAMPAGFSPSAAASFAVVQATRSAVTQAAVNRVLVIAMSSSGESRRARMGLQCAEGDIRQGRRAGAPADPS
jgi:hypothetical protein